VRALARALSHEPRLHRPWRAPVREAGGCALLRTDGGRDLVARRAIALALGRAGGTVSHRGRLGALGVCATSALTATLACAHLSSARSDAWSCGDLSVYDGAARCTCR